MIVIICDNRIVSRSTQRKPQAGSRLPVVSRHSAKYSLPPVIYVK